MSRTKRAVPHWAWTPAQLQGRDHKNWKEHRGLNVDYKSGETRVGWASALSVSRLQRAADKVKVRLGYDDWLDDEHDLDLLYGEDDWYEADDYDYEYPPEPEPDDYLYEEDYYFDDYDYSWDVV